MNGLFSNYLNKKLHVDSDVYHSMNMLGQKRTILNKLRKSLANAPPILKNTIDLDHPVHSRSINEVVKQNSVDNADYRTVDDTSLNSDHNRSLIMYGRCSKYEKWKEFQTGRYLKNRKVLEHRSFSTEPFTSNFASKSTLPVLKYHKEKLHRAKNAMRHSKRIVT